MSCSTSIEQKWVRISQGAETLCHISAYLRGTEPITALTPLLCIAALLIPFLIGFRQWWSRADRVLTLNLNIWLPPFWTQSGALRVGPRPGLGHMCWPGAWAVIIAVVQPRTKSVWQGLVIVFLELSKLLEIQWPTVRVFLTLIQTGSVPVAMNLFI